MGRNRAKPSVIEVLPHGEVRVHLTNSDKFALIDIEDIPIVCPYRWYPRCLFGIWYARPSGTYHGRTMHRILMPDTKQIDHRDGNGLNNRRSNLRPSTQQQNRWNSGKHRRTCSSKFKGVRFKSKRFEATIMRDGVRQYLGRFDGEEDAARAYDAAALRLHGEFARLNLPTTEATA